MRDGRRSRTAQYVALSRALLHERAVVDDPYAAQMLVPSMRLAAAVLRRVPRHTESGLNQGLAARTRLFDDAVSGAIAAGTTQIVIVGAGYDSRSWRFATAGVAFFEVDHPATQADKRRRCPPEGPTFVALDLTRDTVPAALTASGWDPLQRTAFVIEGLTMYLAVDDVRGLFTELGEVSATGSLLAVNFASPVDTPLTRVLAVGGRIHGEPFRSARRLTEHAAFVASCGWHVQQTTPFGGAMFVAATKRPSGS